MDKTWKIVLVLAAIFVVGSACGLLVGMRIGRKAAPTKIVTKSQVQTLEQFSRSQISSIARRLKLTDEQREQIKPFIQKANDELVAQRRRSFRETVDIMERMNSEIEKLLTPEQFEDFTDMRIVQRERMRNLMKGVPSSKSSTDKKSTSTPPKPPPEKK